ncbi:uncharacterized protein N7529_005309 [Penicillium soppii]|uniref:uncharacterized protein n=1 Tax=Penicillium soppii TaxID=69789 RepID=UPI002548C2D0|nr:uncharacterized protein N7529_005309 [Penicillium soppii]KAJ5872956.1 hypothetical protein N7529_005309 [Penicillium soppii]
MDIKCSKQQHSNVVIIGDAAYAVQPFYGQGLNAGLEDVRILFDSLDQLQAHRLGGILLTSFNFIPLFREIIAYMFNPKMTRLTDGEQDILKQPSADLQAANDAHLDNQNKGSSAVLT